MIKIKRQLSIIQFQLKCSQCLLDSGPDVIKSDWHLASGVGMVCYTWGGGTVPETIWNIVSGLILPVI